MYELGTTHQGVVLGTIFDWLPLVIKLVELFVEAPASIL